jgi:hypothetical protein
MAKQPVCPPGGGSKTAGSLFGRLTPNECWWGSGFVLVLFVAWKEKESSEKCKSLRQIVKLALR